MSGSLYIVGASEDFFNEAALKSDAFKSHEIILYFDAEHFNPLEWI